MKALKTTISITELQKIIKIWRSRKITDSTIPKLLDLYLGMIAYMNDKHIYPVENFYDIKMSLRFSTTQSLIEAVKSKHSIKGIPFNLGTVEVPKLSFVKKSFSI